MSQVNTIDFQGNQVPFRHRYVRDKDNHAYGVLVSCFFEGNLLFGWSQVNKSAGDRFDRKKGLEIALNRLRCRRDPNRETQPKVPYDIQKMIEKIEESFSQKKQ